MKELANISKHAADKWKQAAEEKAEVLKIYENCWREMERFRNISMELNERYNDAVDVISDCRRRLEVCRNEVLDHCHTIHVYSIEPDNALCENVVAQSKLDFQNLRKELKRAKKFCDKGMRDVKEYCDKGVKEQKRH